MCLGKISNAPSIFTGSIFFWEYSAIRPAPDLKGSILPSHDLAPSGNKMMFFPSFNNSPVRLISGMVFPYLSTGIPPKAVKIFFEIFPSMVCLAARQHIFSDTTESFGIADRIQTGSKYEI